MLECIWLTRRLAQVERRPDLLHRHLLVVVEDDDEPLVAVQALGDQPHQVAVLQPAGRVFGLLVLEDVDLADVLVAVRLVPLLVQADQADGRGLADVAVELLERHAELLRPVPPAGRAAERGLELLAGGLHLRWPCDRTSRGTQSIVRSSSSMAPRMRGTQYVSNFTPRFRSKASIASIRPKMPAQIRSSSSTPSGSRGPDALGVVLDQRQVPLDQPVPVLDVRPSPGTRVQTCWMSMSDLRHHRAPP